MRAKPIIAIGTEKTIWFDSLKKAVMETGIPESTIRYYIKTGQEYRGYWFDEGFDNV